MGRQKMCFKRWTRKPFGAFMSLKKEVRIGVVSAGCSLLTMIPQASFAQNQADSTHNIRLSDVEITAQRQQVYSDLARIVTVVNKDEILKAPVSTLSDLLRYVAGMDIRQRGANGVQADLSVRGGTFDQVLILLNGVNISDAQTGHFNLDLPVDLSAIDRIEVLQGPGSRVLGPNAFSGAINIITGSSDKSFVGADFVGGENGYLSRGVSAGVSEGKVKAYASISKSESDGYSYDTDFDFTNIFGQVRVDSKCLGNLNFQAGSQNKQFGAYGFYSAAYPNEFEQVRTFFGSVSSSKSIGHFKIEPKLYWREHHDRFELFRDFQGAPAWYANHNYHLTDEMGAALTSSYTTKWGKSSLGVDYRYDHIYSNALGDAIDTKVRAPYAPDSVYFTKEKGRKNLNCFLEQAVFFNKFSASVGALGNYSDDFGSHFYFGSDLGYAFTQHISLFATVNQSLRLPTFTDLYMSNSAQQGDPNLKPEEALTYEFGCKYKKGRLAANVSSFYRQGTNVIDWVKFPTDTKFHSMNHASVDALGGEVMVEYRPEKYIQLVKLSYSYLSINKESGDYVSKYALDYLKNKLSLSLDHSIYKAFSASWRLSWQDRSGTYVEPVKNLVKSYKPFLLTDLRLQWSNKQFTVFTEATNLFDIKYYDYGGIEQPGRWIKGGVSIRL